MVSEYWVHLGYVFMLIALLARDVLWLRSILVLAQGSICAYAWGQGLIGMACWNAAFVVINAIWALLILRERQAAAIPTELQAIHARHFSAMAPREFLRFWAMGSPGQIRDARLVPAGVHPHALLFLVSGQARVSRQGLELARLPRGSFVAEMSLLTGQSTSADVDAIGTVDVRSWSAEQLAGLRSSRPALWIKLQSVLGLDLVEKLKRAAPVNATAADTGSDRRPEPLGEDVELDPASGSSVSPV